MDENVQPPINIQSVYTLRQSVVATQNKIVEELPRQPTMLEIALECRASSSTTGASNYSAISSNWFPINLLDKLEDIELQLMSEEILKKSCGRKIIYIRAKWQIKWGQQMLQISRFVF